MGLQETLGNEKWMYDNADKIKALLPPTWTHMQNIKLLPLGFSLKLLGIDWRSEDDLAKCMVYFERIGLMKRDGLLVRRSI